MTGLLDHSLRLALGGLFVYAGAVKAVDPTAFLTDVEGYRLLPRAAAVMLALYLPWLEVAAGLCLALGVLRRGATAVLLGLTIVFTAALLSAWLRDLDVSCGCFGESDTLAGYGRWLTRDVSIAVGLVLVLCIPSGAERRRERRLG